VSTIQIPNHAHCVVCSRAVPFGDKTCSPTCEADYADLQKRRKRTAFFMYGLLALSILALVLLQFGFFGGGAG
jgi:predicted nucleic acid-binding Zn ribbon protein